MCSFRYLLSTFILVGSTSVLHAQDGVGVGTTSLEPDAIFQVETPGNKGMLVPRVTTAQRDPGGTKWATTDGIIVYDTDIKSLYYFDGSNWHMVGSPSGTIVMWSGSTVPEGWKLCDGTNSTPNLSGRFVVGYDASIEEYNNPGDFSIGGTTGGNTGGQDSVRLLTSEMPGHTHVINNDTHNHSGSAQYGGGHSHPIEWTNDERPMKDTGSNEPDRSNSGSAAKDGGPAYASIPSNTGQHSHTLSINNDTHNHTMQSTGGGAKHENRPPYYVLAYIMKK
ncbi:tail fiber protein [Marinoscillum sp.]|uniref:tail fiber protein n=1 Tax=Marinoscillum sp. TaxID=2024838 RepID=UPI003BA9480D